MGTIIVSNRQVSVVDPVKALRCLFTNRSGRERALNCLTKPCTNALYLCHRGRKQWSELIPVCRRSGTLGLCSVSFASLRISAYSNPASVLQGVAQTQEFFPDCLHLRGWPFLPTLTMVTLSSWAGANFLRLFLVHWGVPPRCPPHVQWSLVNLHGMNERTRWN